MEPVILIKDHSPICNIQALVEMDENTIYFYLYILAEAEEPIVKSCFVCNVKDKKHAISLTDWKRANDGTLPMLPYEIILHSEQGMVLDKELLKIVWTQEGSGAGLFYRHELIAFIPEWADSNMPGFSKYVSFNTPFASEMKPVEKILTLQMELARKFWHEISNDYWPRFQQSHLNAIEAYVGEADNYYAIDNGFWPPKAIATVEKNNLYYGITLGISAFRQPKVELFYRDRTKDFSRIELGFICDKRCEPYFMPVLQLLSKMAYMPWKNIEFFGHGHTVKCELEGGFCALWFLNANLLIGNTTPAYEPAFGERINLLWAIPLLQEEYDFILSFDMKRIFDLEINGEIVIFEGKSKGIIDLLGKCK